MQLRTEIEIDAPAGVVWEILVNGERYHEWNPFITTLEGELREGAQLNVVVSPPDGSDFRFQPRVVKYAPKQELRWRGRVLADFIFMGEHYFELQELEFDRTRVTHGENFRGLLLRFLGRQLTSAARGFVFMNQALKRRAEAQVAQVIE